MQRNEFLESVRTQGNLDSNNEAEEATVATLRTLGERITPGQAEDLASALPDELAGPVGEPETDGAEQLSAEEFLERVSSREAEADTVDSSGTERHVQAVLATLSTATPGEWGNIQNQLPADFERLYEYPSS